MSTTGDNTRERRTAGANGQQRRPAAQSAGGKPRQPAAKVEDNAKGKLRIKEPVIAHHDERVATGLSRNAMSRERYELQLRALFVVFAMLAASMAVNIYFGLRQPEYVYYALNSEGGLTEVIPLENPIQSRDQVIRWTAEAVSEAFTLSFANYTKQLSDYRHLFTESGWQGFQEALERNRILDTIIKQQLVSTAVPAGAPVVTSSGVVASGRYGWRVQIPLIVTYDSASGQNSSTLTVEAVVQRVPETENPRGLAIGQIIAK
jgi:intracellular multiplication protein IcmL